MLNQSGMHVSSVSKYTLIFSSENICKGCFLTLICLFYIKKIACACRIFVQVYSKVSCSVSLHIINFT